MARGSSPAWTTRRAYATRGRLGTPRRFDTLRSRHDHETERPHRLDDAIVALVLGQQRRSDRADRAIRRRVNPGGGAGESLALAGEAAPLDSGNPREIQGIPEPNFGISLIALSDPPPTFWETASDDGKHQRL